MSAARNLPTRGRFVWIGEDESIERLGAVEFARLVTKRRAEAPADPVGVIAAAYLELTPTEARDQASALLGELGYPDA